MHGKPISDDGLITADDRGQLMVWWRDGDSLSATYTPDLRGVRCAICDQLWMMSGIDWADHATTGEPYRRHAHRSCITRHSSLVEASEWFALLVDSPLLIDGIHEIPNEYWPDSPGSRVTAPTWMKVELCLIDKDEEKSRIGYATLKLGWRKRVAHMELRFSTYESGGPITPEQVRGTWIDEVKNTKEIKDESVLVHAWPGNQDEERRQALLSFAQIIRRRFPNARFRKEFPEPCPVPAIEPPAPESAS